MPRCDHFTKLTLIVRTEREEPVSAGVDEYETEPESPPQWHDEDVVVMMVTSQQRK